MPPHPLRRKPTSHGTSSLARFLFPHTRQRARAHLSKFRHDTLSSFAHRTQSRIYKYIIYRQALKLKGRSSILQRLRGHTRRLLGTNSLEDAVRSQRQQLTKSNDSEVSAKGAMSFQDGYGSREPGGRRKKLTGYLKAANELRQTYQQQYAPNWSRGPSTYEYDDETPGGFQDAAVVRSGEEEMILFPSYARKHIRRKPEAQPGTIQETPGEGRDVRDSVGAGDAEFWKQQWDSYEDDNAVVDVDVRGWIYSPHKGQMSRKQRLFVGLARQLVGVSAPPAGAKPPSSSSSPLSSRDPSPGPPGHRERHEMRQAQRDEELAAKEAEEILRRGEREAAMAAKGAYSEKPGTDDDDGLRLFRAQSRDSIRTVASLPPNQNTRSKSSSPADGEENIKRIQKRASWSHPADMNAAEMAEANARLMARLRHFLAVPMANRAISVFFYNDKVSKQRTIYTNPSGHFSICAALDFVPTQVRILVSDELSATEEVIITEAQGVSVISDIDDTIKHSAISSGAREIFRNAFIRDLNDLTIDGVREWYKRMADMGVKFHYVSNSPWQLYPVIQRYFSMAGLPPGSFHLKQYSGMLQGIFEPVAERKKSTLDKIARDFPDRSFILIGDSGEADLEVYTDFVLENPGRVVAVFIRDVTTAPGGGFFDPSIGSMPGDRSSSSQARSGSTSSRLTNSPRAGDEDPEMKAAIAASLRHLDEDNRRRSKTANEGQPERRPELPLRKTTQAQTIRLVSDLIDLSSSDEEGPQVLEPLRRVNSDTKAETGGSPNATMKSAPPLPKKPLSLRSSSGDSLTPTMSSKAPPPPIRRPSSDVHHSSPLSQQTSTSNTRSTPSKPQPPPKPSLESQQSYSGMAREKIASAYNKLPSASSYLSSNPSSSTSDNDDHSRNVTVSETNNNTQAIKKAAPPPPPRRGLTTYPVAAASYVGTKAASAWQAAPALPHPSTRPNTTTTSAQAGNSFSTSSAPRAPTRTNTSSTLGLNGGVNAQGNEYGQAGMNKREVLWRQRWAKAEGILGEKGVVLRSWRAGGDIVDEAERLIRKVNERGDKERRDEQRLGR
jgi:phosphatidate phosphatase APP1